MVKLKLAISSTVLFFWNWYRFPRVIKMRHWLVLWVVRKGSKLVSVNIMRLTLFYELLIKWVKLIYDDIMWFTFETRVIPFVWDVAMKKVILDELWIL